MGPTTKALTIVIADDHAVVREGLRMMLEAEDDFAVVGEASDLAQTQALLLDRAPGVLVLDLHMGRELSLRTLLELRGASPSTAIVILTMDDDPAFARPAWNAGAAGYVLKEASRTDLVRAIRTVGKGGRYLDPAIGGWALEGGGHRGVERAGARGAAAGGARPHQHGDRHADVHQPAHGRDPPRQPAGASSASADGLSSSATRSSTG